ncbi:PREDICTED: stachyose synthase [Nicotiana attenuata]|uniref:Stachyose synthase n=1 Tax=Nicotiana attenuata TaxID=49451 RepID=A0A1J6IVJ8_NICAT|nr:PREDICTED: stachyose synthase [Nicotiana attenuata]OIT08300.1 stachyose synthase [Nicotiana attenuata]
MAPPNDPIHSIFNVLMKTHSYFELSDGKLLAKNVPLLFEVPNNVSFSTFSSVCRTSDAPLPLFHRAHSTSFNGGFLGFRKEEPSHRLMNSLGKFSDRNFLSIFRFKTWWSTQWVGNSGSDLQMETQWLLLDVPEIKSYVIIIPIIEGKFRSALHPGTNGHVHICAESGSSQVKESSFGAIAYIHVSDNPYNLMKEAYTALRVYLNTFKLLEEKSLPPIVNKFGWCTWDAFYLTVEPAGVWHGVNEFSQAGISPSFLIIDDGWQSINFDDQDSQEDAKNLVLGGTQMTARLHRLDEGEKFRKYKAGSLLGPNPPLFDHKKPKMLICKAIEIEHAEKARDKVAVTDMSELDTMIEKMKKELYDMFGGDQLLIVREQDGDELRFNNQGFSKPEDTGMKAFTKDLRTHFKGLDDIYVWHALCGAWGGVRPGTAHLNSKIIPCKLSPGLEGTMDDLAVVKIVEDGIGLVHPDQADDFYDSMHSYLSNVGITGVKVDVIHTLEYISEEYGGRVELAKKYYNGLSKSLAKNFKGTGLVSSMQQCNDFFFLGTKQISMGRVGDDFWFQDPNGDPNGVYWLQGVHMIHCAYNSMWMGQIIQPDWDMFQSDHVCAKFHAGSRAICGGPVYVSDSLGGHDFDLLKKLVFPDGTIPKCQYFALPTRDCIFKNPLFDGKTILKIWNFNKCGGVIGAFNCQGAGWDPKERRIKGYSRCYKPMTGSVHVNDIEWDQLKEASEMGKAEEYAVYLNQAEKLFLTKPFSDTIPMAIKPSSFEIFSFVPIKQLSSIAKFAPIGLTNMFNSGGTIQGLQYEEATCIGANASAKVEVKGGGNFLAYSSVSPIKCYLNGAEIEFEWSSEDGKLTLNLSWIEEANGISNVTFHF